MRRFQSIWLYLSLTAVFMQSFTVPLVFMSFELNREYIAAELCVNREIPESGCDGQCYLMKKLKQTQEDSQGTERPVTKREAFWQHCTNLAKRPTLLPLREMLALHATYEGYISFCPASIFHPPEQRIQVLS